MVQDAVMVLSTHEQSLKISTVTQISIAQMVQQCLQEGNLQTALNIVMSTGGQGRRQLREYQLKLAKYSDIELLSDFLE